ncbi:MAG: metallophosphoesterase [Planctomycetes bacterium]|nr:metallophosphoesterase [Planctomycetota bacterium]
MALQTQAIIELLKKAANANRYDVLRRGNVVNLPAAGSVVVAGDIHGHRRNFERVAAFANLAENPDRYVILQEIIHGGPEDADGGCLSYQLLFDIARYKLDFPGRVHIIMGNHDTVFINDGQVMKNGKEMNYSMNVALKRQFNEDSGEIKLAIKEMLLSQPLAARTESRIWISHSLPDNRNADKIDVEILNRKLTSEDCDRDGSVHYLTWGRKHSQKTLDKMAKLFDADIFVLGHQTQSRGWSKAGENLIIIASEHSHGCLLAFDLAKSYTIEELSELITPLASIS